MAFTMTFLPLCFFSSSSTSQMALMSLVMPGVLRSFSVRTLPLSFFPAFVFPCAFPRIWKHTFHSEAVNGAPAWCGDYAGQCAPLCDCMPPRLRLSLDTSQPSRPADLYPTVTQSERHRETGRERESGRGREAKCRGVERERERDDGRQGERM